MKSAMTYPVKKLIPSLIFASLALLELKYILFQHHQRCSLVGCSLFIRNARIKLSCRSGLLLDGMNEIGYRSHDSSISR